MRTATVELEVPEGLAPYLVEEDPEGIFERGAMLLYPLVRALAISHGRAAEILGVPKAELIDFYGSMGIPYLDQSQAELMADLETLGRVVGAGA